MNKPLYSGPTTRAPEYQSLLHINHIKSCPTYWHHTFIYLTSPFFYHLYLETSHRPFHIISRLTSTIYNTSVLYQIRGPTQLAKRSRSARAAEIPGALRQSEGFLLARMYDVIHHPTRYYDNKSAHDIPTSNIIIWRKSIIPSDKTIPNPYLLHNVIIIHTSQLTHTNITWNHNKAP